MPTHLVNRPSPTPLNPEAIQQVMQAVELFLDLTLGLFIVLAVKISHNMIIEKMQLKREARDKGATKRAVDASGAAAAAEDEPDEGVDRRVTAKASMRARRRMA